MGRAMGNRWQTHRVLAWVIRIALFLLPIVAGLVVSYQVATRLSDGDSVGAVLVWWTAVIGSALLSAYIIERLLRGLVPVTTLLRLSLAFPDKAPSRFSVMLRSFTTRSIGRRLAAGELDHLPAERSASEELLGLLASLAAHDPQTRGHAERVRAYADLIGEELGLGQAERDRLRWGALLHDIGKVAIPANLLNKTDELDESDWAMLRTHPAKGDELITGLHDWLGDWRLTVVQHHERWDGNGYPLGLSGREIALGGRIVSVCDAFDAMTSVRAYGDRLSAEAARTEIARVSGDQFDPTVVRALMRVSIGRLRAPLGVWAWIPAFTVPGAIERLGKHTSVIAAGLMLLFGATALAADHVSPPSPAAFEIEVAGISIEPSDVEFSESVGEGEAVAAADQEQASGSSSVTSNPAVAEPAPPSEQPEVDAPVTAAAALEAAPAPTANVPPSQATSEPSPSEGDPPSTATTTAATTTTTVPATTTTTVAATATTTVPATTTTTSVPPPPQAPIAPDLSIVVEEDGVQPFVVDARGVTDLADAPARGFATIDGLGSGWYRPDPDVNGVDVFTYRACLEGVCAEGVVSVEITAVNDPPVAIADEVEISSDAGVTIRVLENDMDVDGDRLVVASIGVPTFGVASTDGTVIDFRPLGTWGEVQLEYTACDPFGACSTALVRVAVSESPSGGATADVFVISGSSALDVLANDTYGSEPITVTVVEAPAEGKVQVLGNQSILFKPHRFIGTVVFVYEVCDASGTCSQATVTVTVE